MIKKSSAIQSNCPIIISAVCIRLRAVTNCSKAIAKRRQLDHLVPCEADIQLSESEIILTPSRNRQFSISEVRLEIAGTAECGVSGRAAHGLPFLLEIDRNYVTALLVPPLTTLDTGWLEQDEPCQARHASLRLVLLMTFLPIESHAGRSPRFPEFQKSRHSFSPSCLRVFPSQATEQPHLNDRFPTSQAKLVFCFSSIRVAVSSCRFLSLLFFYIVRSGRELQASFSSTSQSGFLPYFACKPRALTCLSKILLRCLANSLASEA